MRNLLLTLALFAGSAYAGSYSVGTSGCPNDSCDYPTVQDALDIAECGDVFTVYSAIEDQWTLQRNDCEESYITIRGLNIFDFGQGVRATDADAALLPDMTIGFVEPIIKAAKGADHYIIEGLEFKLTGSQDPSEIVQLLSLGPVCACDDNSRIEDLPHHIIFRKNIFRGLNRNQDNFGNCMVANTGMLVVEDNSFIDCYNPNPREAHAFTEWNAKGPITWRNNHSEGSQISTLVGGANPTIHGLTLTGYDVIGNHFFRPFSWRVTSGATDPTGACAYDSEGGEWFNQTMSMRYWECVEGTWTDTGVGTAPQTSTFDKNQFELKNVVGANVYYNLMENGWDTPNNGSQHGGAILLNQVDEGNPHTQIESVDISYNRFVKTSWGISQGVIGNDYFRAPQNISITNNVGVIGGAAYGEEPYPCGIQTSFYGKENIDHNTILFDRDSEASGGRPICGHGVAVGLFSWNFNIMHFGSNADSASGGIYEDAGFSGGGLWNAPYSLFGLKRQLGGNVWINQLACNYNGMYDCPEANGTAGPGSAPDDTVGYIACPSCKVAADNTAMGFVDYPFNLTLDPSSPYYRSAHMGLDPGADVGRVNEGTSATVSGAENPYMDMKINFITPGTTTAQMSYVAYGTFACDITVTLTDPDRTEVFSETDSGGSRARSMSITDLSSNTRYMAELNCDGAPIRQIFYTR